MAEEQSASTSAAPLEASRHPSDHLKLRVTYLIAGNPRPPHDLGLVNASTTVAELKSRLQQELLEHPQPHEQRLIYQGRPLMQSSATLREALRLEGPIGPLPYTVHIIISSRPASSHFRPAQPVQTAQQHPQTDGQPLHNPPISPQQTDPQAALEQVQRLQAMANAHLSMLQQQMGGLGPAMPGQLPPNFNATIQIQGQQILQSHNMHHHHHHGHHPHPSPSTNPLHHPPSLPGHQTQQQPRPPGPVNLQNSDLSTAAAPRQEQPPPFQGPADPLAGLRQSHGLESIPRPSSAPGHPPSHSGVPTQQPRHVQAPSMSRMSQTFGPIPLPFPQQVHNPFAFSTPVPNQNLPLAQPTVWLASSRLGPQALLFAPGNGYFTSAPPSRDNITRLVPPIPTTVPMPTQTVPVAAPGPADPLAVAAPTQAPQPPNAAPGEALQQNAQVARIRHRLERQRNANANANPENEDIFAFIVQRTWLFLRLYMFIYVLSEPGTWRRYLLQFLAVIICVLPRRNPLNDTLVAARRHFDRLIGPPQRQRREGQHDDNARNTANVAEQAQDQSRNASPNAPANPDAGQAGPSNAPETRRMQGAVDTTPEETAQRLVREHTQRNPNIVRDVLYRIEQAMALFLASLIPGVGERHVAAREEVRREEERIRLEEAARREREEAEKKAREEQQEEDRGKEDGSAGPSTQDQENGKGKGKEIKSNQSLAEEMGFEKVQNEASSAGFSSGVEEANHQGDARARFT